MVRRILVVGVGSIGERHVRCFQNTGRATVSIVEPNEALRRQIAERYQVESAYLDVASALKQPFDAAVICSPAHTHIPIAIDCAQQGLNLLIEKPLSVDTNRIVDLREIVERKSLVAAVAYVYRSHPVLDAMRQRLASGTFGDPVQVVATTGQHFPKYRPAYREIYYANHATGGGAIQDALTHLLNAAEWLVGPLTAVVADADHLVLEGVNVEDTVHVIGRHSNVLGCYSLNQHQAPNEFTLTVVCTGGTVRFESHHNRYRWMTEPGGEWHDESFAPLERDTLFTLQAKYFLDSLDGVTPRCTLAAGEQTLKVNLAVLNSARSREWIDIAGQD